MFRKILVANRGEIARRIFLACHELGVPTVAIYAEPEAEAPWTYLADERYALPGITASETYLNQEAILHIARTCGAEAIHPGYGFLSENPTFATACAQHNITFIGPSPEAMEVMGSKAAARVMAQEAGVPVVPGIDGANKSEKELAAAAAAIGYPVLIKASAGGGGKGMRVVWSAEELADGVQAAQREAESAFGNDHILLEKFFTKIHHVEIQVLGDTHGGLLHLFERECSIQRRHQKIIEECPAPIIVDETVRQAIAAAAVSLAHRVQYVNAGTVEFIVTPEGDFYFLEMNTRLQVEHPVTELVTGLDIATWQIRIAAGETLPFTQTDIQQRGHALECRIYAEDPANHFLPSIGEIVYYQRPSGPGVRVDDGIVTGSQVTPYYDPMLAKIITWGQDRPEAIGKMVRALQDTIILGVTTNVPYLLTILQAESFVNGRTNTSYLQTYMTDWQPQTELTETDWLALSAWEEFVRSGGVRQTTSQAQPTATTPWHTLNGWRNVVMKQ